MSEKPQRKLSLFDVTNLVIGAIIGAEYFPQNVQTRTRFLGQRHLSFGKILQKINEKTKKKNPKKIRNP